MIIERNVGRWRVDGAAPISEALRRIDSNQQGFVLCVDESGVLEGVLTLFIENEQHELFPGDSAHYPSATPHNWANYTSKMVRLLVVGTPNPFLDKGAGR